MLSQDLSNQHFDAIIIGAGMSGLAAGIRLALFNKKVLILERHYASGGLNSFYSRNGRKYDVGLHALTNYVAPHIKGTPLGKLFRQLRISRDEFALSEQNKSEIKFQNQSLFFSNQFELFESEVAREFPHEIDNFRKLVAFIKTFDGLGLDKQELSAIKILKNFINDERLIKILLLPLMYYGSSQENDMDWNQFVIMFKSIFLEGFCKPLDGVRRIIRILTHKYRLLGGLKRMKSGVKRIIIQKSAATAVELDNGEYITANTIFSSAGALETMKLCEAPISDKKNEGQLSFVECILSFDKTPKTENIDQTIVFFNQPEDLIYQKPDTLIDDRSGVICFPDNYKFPLDSTENAIRMTFLANYNHWKSLSVDAYKSAKNQTLKWMTDRLTQIIPQSTSLIKNHLIDTDLFTPITINKFTGHINGTVYGSIHKFRNGQTPYKNLFLCGTDQGFLGIIGSLLSGISMANLHILKAE